jgi:hypothetical protein
MRAVNSGRDDPAGTTCGFLTAGRYLLHDHLRTMANFGSNSGVSGERGVAKIPLKATPGLQLSQNAASI